MQGQSPNKRTQGKKEIGESKINTGSITLAVMEAFMSERKRGEEEKRKLVDGERRKKLKDLILADQVELGGFRGSA